MSGRQIIVIGAGMGGLAAAIDLAAAGVQVTILEKAATPGGKMREIAAGPFTVDSGPTVFTMRWVFDALFENAGASLSDELALTRADILARHAWDGGATLDLHADPAASTDAIGTFAGRDAAEGFKNFTTEAATIFATLKGTYLEASRPTPISLAGRIGLHRPGALLAIKPFSTLWSALGHHFRDPRLRQLFGRYATYCGASPFDAPATLMLIAHVEQEGVWLVGGGMQRLADAMQRLATRHGAEFRFGADVASIDLEHGRASAVTLSSGERLTADAILCNADTAALAAGRFGTGAKKSVSSIKSKDRSLSAVTWSMAARLTGFTPERHNVFFSTDYAAEFAALKAGRLPEDPTIYLCANTRPAHATGASEPLLLLANAPARGDTAPLSSKEIDACLTRSLARLQRCGLTLTPQRETMTATAPQDFARLFPATGGALYGRATHGWMASFQRPGATTSIPGLYLAGGSAHPGAGVPMAAQSGRLAAARLLADLPSIRPSRRAAISGGMSTASATMDAKP